MRTFFSIALLTGSLAASALGETGIDAQQIAFFESKVRPLLIESCYECHSHESKVKGGLALDSQPGWQAGGDSGAVIVPGKPDESLLVRAVSYLDSDYEMPPKQKLPDAQIEILRQWIAMGAPDPRHEPAGEKEASLQVAAADLWSFQPVRETEPPQTPTAQADIDRFIEAKLIENHLPFADPADPVTLLRRLYWNLTGLPPTPAQVDAFVTACQKDRDAAVEDVVDELLDSPGFGDRWARHWLDLTAYADTIGVGRAIPAPEAWRYRDYVIAAFNNDKPLPDFIRQQIAGDIRLPGAPGQREEPMTTAEDLVATGFLAIGAWELVNGDKEQLRMDVVDRQVNRIGKAFLGMTMECARCHDHKFDPVSQKDYYAMAGILRSTVTLDGRLNGVFSNVHYAPLPETPDQLVERAERLRDFQQRKADAQAKANAAKAEVAKLEKQVASAGKAPAKPDDDDAAEDEDEPEAPADPLSQKLAEAKAASTKAAEALGVLNYLEPHLTQSLAMTVRDRPEPEPAHINIRGSAHQLGELVPLGFLSEVAPKQKPTLTVGSSGRPDLADWIASKDNPLTARVWVNRIWHHLFGTGLVRTVDNFGAMGEAPSHPELLDHLAATFVEDGWSTKKLIRRILLTRTWQQASANEPAIARGVIDLDPDNRLLWRGSRRRLEAEALRDTILAVTGELDAYGRGGPSLPLEIPGNFKPNATGIVQDNLKLPDDLKFRRTIYLPQRRAGPFEAVSFIEAFGLPSTNAETGYRTDTALPSQALNLANSPFIQERARRMAKRHAHADPQARVRSIFRGAYHRLPTADELRLCLGFIDQLRAELSSLPKPPASPADEAWARFCQSILMSNEFLFRT